MTMLSGTAFAGIFIFSGMLFPFLNGKQSTGGKYLNAYHCKPKLKIVTKSIKLVFNPEEKRCLICFLVKRMMRINAESKRSLYNEYSVDIFIQSPKHPQLVGLPVL